MASRQGWKAQVGEYEEVVEVAEAKWQTGVKTRCRPRFAGSFQSGWTYRKYAVMGLVAKIYNFIKKRHYMMNLPKDVSKNIKMVIDYPYIPEIDKGKFIEDYNRRLLNLNSILKNKNE